jgi:hypothetical protein
VGSIPAVPIRAARLVVTTTEPDLQDLYDECHDALRDQQTARTPEERSTIVRERIVSLQKKPDEISPPAPELL